MREKYLGWKKIAASMLVMSLTLGMAGCGAANVSADTQKLTESTQEEEEIQKVLTETVGRTGGVGDADKEETVYVIADANGNTEETIVSEWLRNASGESTICDKSSLTDIENVKGDEGFTQDGNNLLWQAEGSDIYYQGVSTKEAPVAVNVTYYLDGKEISPEDLEGKSGHVKLRYDYINNSKSGDVYTPFIMATGITLDMNIFSNIKVVNGKLISDGTRYIAVGYGFPKLAESLDIDSLGIDDLNIELPEYFELEADVKNFSLGMSLTIASVETIGDEDIDISEKEEEIDDLSSQYQTGMNTLTAGIVDYTDGVSQVASGVDTLYSGSETLYSGAGTLKSGVESAADGADTIKSGLDSAYSGSTELSDGADSAYDGAVALSNGATALNDAVQDITLPDVNEIAASGADDATKQSIVSTAEGSLGTDTSSYVGSAVSSVVTGAISSDTVSQVVDYQTNGAAAVQSAATAAGTAAGQAQADTAASLGASEGTTAGTNYAGTAQSTAVSIVQGIYGDAFDPTDETQANLIGTLTAAIAGAYGEGYGTGYGTAYATGYGTGYGAGYADEYQTYLTEFSNYTTALSNGFSGDNFTGTISNVANAYAGAGASVTLSKVGDEISTFSDSLDSLKTATQSLADGSSALSTGLGTLSTGASSLENGLSALDTGAGTLQSGMSELKSGSATLYSGTETLYNGVSELKDGTDTLVSNNTTLNDGADALSDATDEIMDKLSETEDGVDSFVENLNSVNEAGRNYKSFAGAAEDTTVKTQFVIKVSGIGDKE